MGNLQQELEASCELIVTLARKEAAKQPALLEDVEYGAQLALAAPDLLEACRCLVYAFAPPRHEYVDANIECARAAIAKAKA